MNSAAVYLDYTTSRARQFFASVQDFNHFELQAAAWAAKPAPTASKAHPSGASLQTAHEIDSVSCVQLSETFISSLTTLGNFLAQSFNACLRQEVLTKLLEKGYPNTSDSYRTRARSIEELAQRSQPSS
ncbi:hypothetical protein ACFX12_035659 [Malus domestica]